jgi:TorA maturation chaperone TorD
MALLALREAEAWEREDTAAAESRIRQQQMFLDRHILQWVPRWIEQVAQKTQEPVYWAFAGLISAALAHTAEVLKIAAD